MNFTFPLSTFPESIMSAVTLKLDKITKRIPSLVTFGNFHFGVIRPQTVLAD